MEKGVIMRKLRVSTQTEVTAERFGDQKSVRLLCETGFDAIDYSMFFMNKDDCILNTDGYKAHITELKNIADSYGVPFNQCHSMFPSMRGGDDNYNKKTFPRLQRAIEICGLLDAGTVIIHPVQFSVDQFNKNIDLYMRLLPTAKEYGVKIALENMWGYDMDAGKIIPNVCSTRYDFPEYVDALPKEYFTACLDIGHCGLVGDNAPDMIRALGHDRLTNLHVHDNDNKRDLHYPPFTFELKWVHIAEALNYIDYTGEITLEADGFMYHMPDEILPSAVKLLYDSAKKFAEMVENS